MKYKIIKEKQQQEVNAFPLGFAFSKDQFKKMMENWGLTENDTDKIYSIGAGGYVQKKDAERMNEMFERNTKEHLNYMFTDDEYAYTAFKYELYNHEYAYTGEIEDTLDSLLIDSEDLTKDNNRLLNILRQAKRDILSEEE